MKKFLFLFSLFLAAPAFASLTLRAGLGADGAQLNRRSGPMLGLWAMQDGCVNCVGVDFGTMTHGLEGHNKFIGADFTHGMGNFSATLGGAYFERPLNVSGRVVNFHLGLAYQITPRLGLYLDHWSNGRRYFRSWESQARNIPRNVLSVGVGF